MKINPKNVFANGSLKRLSMAQDEQQIFFRQKTKVHPISAVQFAANGAVA